jgi:hypothetical protein
VCACGRGLSERQGRLPSLVPAIQILKLMAVPWGLSTNMSDNQHVYQRHQLGLACSLVIVTVMQ